MQIDDKLLTYLEDLSCLRLSDDEKTSFKKDLQEILDYMARLGELNTDGVVERSHPLEPQPSVQREGSPLEPQPSVQREGSPLDDTNVFRDDEARPSFDRELILKNAPVRNDEFFIAPKTVE
jgi:aspartyl/glutamyl-tRNA(Asn/Gln) amidotransferase C subunit